VVLLGAALAASQFSGLHVILDNLSNFIVHFAAGFLVCSLVLAIAGSGRWAFVSALGLAVSLVPVVPWYFSPDTEPAADGASSARLLVSNLHFRNRRYDKLAQLIERERPDVIGLIEVNSEWLANLAPLRKDYAFWFEAPDNAHIGLALLSKIPLRDPRIMRFGDPLLPAIAATIQMPTGEIELILAHPPPPLAADLASLRNAQLRGLARHACASKNAVLIAGDLNVTMWNRHYRSLAKHGGLHNARAGHGIGPTWPSIWPFGIPIDHILATSPVRFRGFRVHEDIGSDHLPISAEIVLDAHAAGIPTKGGSSR